MDDLTSTEIAPHRIKNLVKSYFLAVREGGLELTSTPSRRGTTESVLPHKTNDLQHVPCG